MPGPVPPRTGCPVSPVAAVPYSHRFPLSADATAGQADAKPTAHAARVRARRITGASPRIGDRSPELHRRDLVGTNGDPGADGLVAACGHRDRDPVAGPVDASGQGADQPA